MKWKLTKFVNPFLIVVLSLILITGCGTDTPDYSINSSEESGEISVEAEVSVDERTGTAGDESSEEGQALFSQLKGKKFTFSSGVGGWMTSIEMQENGKFKGYYMDSELGETGSNYPNGTYYESEFTGQFLYKKKVDDYTYSVSLENVKTAKEEGNESISDGVKHIAADPYGFDTGKSFKIYAKGHPMDTLPQDFLDWVRTSAQFSENDQTLAFWGIYNEEPDAEWGYGMFEDPDAVLFDDDLNTTGNTESGSNHTSEICTYIGKTGNDVIKDFGTDYVRETYEGADGIDYRDKGIWFFLWESGLDAPVSVISVSTDYDIGFGLNAQMTLPELKKACRKLDVSVGEPELNYNELDDMSSYNLTFAYKDYYFQYFWNENSDPDNDKSEWIYIRGKKYSGDTEVTNNENTGSTSKTEAEVSSSGSVTESQAKQIAIKEAESNPDNAELTVDKEYVEIYDKNSDAYIVFVPVGDEDGAGYVDVIWVNAKTGDAKHIDGVQESWPGMYDVSTGKKLY